MNKQTLFRLFAVASMLLVVLSPTTAASPAVETQIEPTTKTPIEQTAKDAPATAANIRRGQSSEDPLDKLHPSLRELVQKSNPALPDDPVGDAAAPDDSILISFIASVDEKVIVSVDEKAGQAPTLLEQLRPYFVDDALFGQPTLGAQKGLTLQVLFGRIRPSNLMKVASHRSVLRVYPIEAEKVEYESYPPDDPIPQKEIGPEEWAQLRATADSRRAGVAPWDEAKAFGDGREPAPRDWFEVMPDGPHKAQAAWDRGYTGEGVVVAVDDDGVDFAHPDLMGTQHIYSGTFSSNPTLPSPYNGWPYAFDPFTMRAYAYDINLDTTFISGAHGGTTYIDTSATPELTPCGSGISCFAYTPLIDYNTPGYGHTYVIADSMSQSGVVHVGTHHDESLRDYVWGERVAVLVTDPNTAGVYDTVYVDLDDDYDFRDEKPVTRADPDNPATYNNPISYRDMSVPPDGIADLSGGLLYFIADGVNYIPASDWLWDGSIPPPDNGDLIAMHGPWNSGYSHGTQCASNVVAQGVVDGMLPEFRDLAPGPGRPAAAVYGMAPDAGLVPMNDAWVFTGRTNMIDGYFFLAIGWDANDQTGYNLIDDSSGFEDTDLIVASSHSYGFSGDFNDGYDYLGQIIAELQRNWAPYAQYLFSTGNGGPGYGTVAPPSPATGIAVGASTQFGSTGWDSITDTTQITFNEVTPFSNSGPGARDGAGPDVVAGGAYAAGAEELNYYTMDYYGVLDGNVSWEDWGGTSRSAPVALGIYALMAQAYKDSNGVWPTHEQGKALLMSSATDVNYGVYKQGAGSVNGDRVTQVASGEYGVYMQGDSAHWEPGDYRGTYYPAFAHVVYAGDTWNKNFTVVNDGPSAVTVDISDAFLERIGSEEFDFTVTEQMVADESAYGAENRDNFGKGFNYFIPITATAGMDASWYNIDIPPETDLMVVRQIFPFDEFDADGDYGWDNRFYLVVYDWTDQDGDGIVWDDKDSNGVVNFINGPYLGTDGLKIGQELAWDDPRTEIDRWEFVRYGYNRPSGNANEISVQDPLNRMHDGLFIGLRHHPGSSYTGDTHLQYRIEFYRKTDVPWLSTDVVSLTVPATSTATFQGTVNVPGDMPTGDYSAAIEVVDPGLMGGSAHTTIIPVALNVVEDFDGHVTLGGVEAYTYDEDRAYNNGAVRGYFDWGWREESGDWRFFYVDIENCTPQAVYTEDFETDNGGYTAGGTNSSWAWGTPTSGPGGAHSGVNVWATNLAGDYNADESSYIELEIDLSSAVGNISLDWWEYANVETGWDSWYADVSNDGGGSWTRLQWWTGNTGAYWNPQFDLDTSYAVSNFRIRFGLISDSSTEAPGLYIDDITIAAGLCKYDQETKILVKDEWDSAAPHTDIDTIVLGPTTSGMSDVGFGAWAGDFSDSSYYGPYVLDVIASSPDDRAGRSIWRFNTSSGGNEDWVSFPIGEGGLHELLQHNILFEGDAFDVVFTKTVGMLYEDVHDFDIDTYVDEGELGAVTLTPTLDLNGLQAEGYIMDVDMTDFIDEPVPFVSSGTIEWTYEFTVTNGVSIEMWTGSGDIADIDLYLFYWNGSTWEQRGSSTGADASEHILVLDPPDGQWRAGINNWSGPAGHFDLAIDVTTKVPGSIYATGTTTETVAANTPVELTVYYDHPMTPDQCYDGMLYVGPPEAPKLKEIPITICREPDSAYIDKMADRGTVYPGMEYDYTVDLYNLSDAAAHFEFADPIPANTEFVTASGTCTVTYDSVLDQVTYTGTLPVVTSTLPQDEGFEDGTMPPPGWVVEHLGDAGANEWDIVDTIDCSDCVYDGDYAAWVNYDSANYQDEWLYSPWFLVSEDEASFRAASDTLWPGATVRVYAVNSDMSMDLLWDMIADETWSTFTYRRATLDMSAYAGQRVQLAWQYVGLDGESFGMDDIHLAGAPLPSSPSCFTDITVRASDTVAGGTYITNTATLVASHFGGDQVEPTRSASAVVVVSEDYPWITKSADYDVTFPSNDIVYTIVLDNYLDPATFSMEDFIPENTEFVDVDGATYDAGQDRIVFDDVVTDTHTIELTVRVTDTLAADTMITNTATLSSTVFTGERSATALVRVGSADLSTSYKEATSVTRAGEYIDYAIHIENTGFELASVTFTDTIPAGTTYAGHYDGAPYQHFQYDPVDDAMKWTGNIAPGEEWVFSFSVLVDDDTALWYADIENVATVVWKDGTLNLDASTEILPPAQLYLPLVARDYTAAPDSVADDIDVTPTYARGVIAD